MQYYSVPAAILEDAEALLSVGEGGGRHRRPKQLEKRVNPSYAAAPAHWSASAGACSRHSITHRQWRS